MEKAALRNIDGKKSTDIGKISPKLVKLSEKVLSQPLAITINNIFNKEYFQIMLKLHAFLPWINILPLIANILCLNFNPLAF